MDIDAHRRPRGAGARRQRNEDVFSRRFFLRLLCALEYINKDAAVLGRACNSARAILRLGVKTQCGDGFIRGVTASTAFWGIRGERAEREREKEKTSIYHIRHTRHKRTRKPIGKSISSKMNPSQSRHRLPFCHAYVW